VPNPGFEEHKLDSVFYWEQPGRPYYHFGSGISYAHSGNCINGICIWKNDPSEYLQVKLDSTLIKDKKYTVTAYTMISSVNLSSVLLDTIKYLGIYFSNQKVNVSSKKILYFKPQVYLDVYHDSIWHKNESTFIAKGDERYMLIGHFYELYNELKKANDSIYENVFKKLENIDFEKSEEIKTETSKIEEKYKKLQQDSWNIDKIKNQRKREKLINDYKTAMFKKQEEIQNKTVEITKKYEEKSNEIYSEYNISPKMGFGFKGFRLFFDDISVIPFHEMTATKEKIIPLNNVFFNTSKSDLLPASFSELDKQVNFLNENSDIIIEVSGHTDNTGKETDNQILSENRAKAVAEYFIEKGIDNSRITYKGYGSSKPIATNDTEVGRAKNRRVEIKIIGN